MADIKVRFPLPDYTDPTKLPLITLVDQGDGTFAPKISGGGGGGGSTGGAPTDADYIVKTANSSLSAEIAIGAGTAGKILTSNGTNPVYGQGPLTTDGDLMLGRTAGTPARLAVGTSGQIVQSDGTNPAWVTPTDSTTPAAISTAGSSGSATTYAKRDHVHAHEAAHLAHDTLWDAAGDLVVGSGADAAAKLSIGSAGKILTSDGTTAAWGNGPMTTAGDLIYGGASGAPTRLAAGAAGKHLVSTGVASAPVWQSASSYVYQDATVITASGDSVLLSTGSVAFAAGLYILMAGWHVNTVANGDVGLRVDGSALLAGGLRQATDARLAVGYQYQNTVWLADGGSHTITIHFGRESGTAVFGLGGDPRWGRHLVMVGPL